MKPAVIFSSPKFRRVLMVIGGVLLGVLLYAWYHAGEESTDDAMLEGHVVTISPKVGGYIKLLEVNDNQQVKAGDLLLQVDPADYQIRLDHAKAGLEQAKAAAESSGINVETTTISAPSNLDAAKAQVAAADANWQRAEKELQRMERLSDEARSREQLDTAIAAEKTARSTLEDAKAKFRSAQTAPKVIAAAKAANSELLARIKQAEAEVAQAEKDLSDTRVLAPIDGYIIKRGIELGNYVQPGQALGFIVGNDLWVVANFKETQLKAMKEGQKVSIDVDAFPHAELEGKVESIQRGTGSRFSVFPAENATGNFVKIVQRVPVKILLSNDKDNSLPLGPGMSVVPTVYTH